MASVNDWVSGTFDYLQRSTTPGGTTDPGRLGDLASALKSLYPTSDASTPWYKNLFPNPDSALKNIQKQQAAPDYFTGTQQSVAGATADKFSAAINEYFGRAAVVVLGFVFVAAGLTMFGKRSA